MVRRRGVLVLVGLLLVGWAIGAGPDSGTTPPPAGGHEADVLLTDGTKLNRVRVMLPVIRLKADYGTLDLDPAKVQVIDLMADNAIVTANVTLREHTQLYGPLLTPDVTLTVDGQPRTVPAAQVAQVKYRHPKDPTLLAALIGLLTLTLMEIILGVDNVVLLAIYVDRVAPERQKAARIFGLGGALVTRLLLLATLSWLVGLTRPLFVLPQLPLLNSMEARGVSWRDLILFFGGLFLIYKAAMEMHEKVQEHRSAIGAGDGPSPTTRYANFWGTIAQLAAIDILFSLDSVITAVGMVDELWVMATAVIVSVTIMLVAAKPIGDFVNRRPTVKVLALSFLILIGALLVAESLGQHIDKGYIYFAMAFAVGVEMVNVRLR